MKNCQEKSPTSGILKKLYHIDLKSFLIKSFDTLHPNQNFIDNWHIDLIVNYLKSIEEGNIKRLLINMPPRSLKSFCISVVWPGWILANDPTKKVIVVSYSQALSNKHSLDCKSITQAEWFKYYFPNFHIIQGQNQKNKFVTSEHGFRFATSLGSTLTGEGADIIIIDDPISSLQAASASERMKCINWYEQTLSSRLNSKKDGVIVLVMQRLHMEDLSAHLLRKNIFEHIKLEAIAENTCKFQINDFHYLRRSGEILNKYLDSMVSLDLTKKELGGYAFEAQYQQNPIAINISIIKPSWIQRYNSPPENFDKIYQSWDTAIKSGEKNDYSVCTTWGIKDNSFYLINLFREKLEYPELKNKIMQIHQAYKAEAVLIEDKASGQQLIQELQSSPLNIIKYNLKYDKTTRLILSSVHFESGKIYFPNYTPWLKNLEEELFCFPNTKHDDQVDSITQFLLWITNKQNLLMNMKYI